MMTIINIEEVRINCMKLLNVEVQGGDVLLHGCRIKGFVKESLKIIPKAIPHSI